MNINIERLEESFNVTSEFGKTENGGLRRLALNDYDKQVRDKFCEWLKKEGLTVLIDDAGNIHGRRAGTDNTLPPIKMGSHLDTVYNGGKFDGITGVLSGLEVIRTLNDNNIVTKRPVEITVWTNEEGARFEPPMLGSGIVTGNFTKEYVYNIKDKQGLTYIDELKRIGYLGDEANRPGEIGAYLEMHIEQGPVLDNENIPVAVLNGVQGMAWLQITIKGEADHAGPSPMATRKDSLLAAAKIIDKSNEIAYMLGKGTTTTVGRISVFPDIINVIPGTTKFTFDIRNEDDNLLNIGIDMFKNICNKVCDEVGVTCDIVDFWKVGVINFNKEVVSTIEDNMKNRGYSYKKMYSGAGHDASYLAGVCPTGMIFVRTIGGKSHCEEELADYKDIEKGANVLLDTVIKLANK